MPEASGHQWQCPAVPPPERYSRPLRYRIPVEIDKHKDRAVGARSLCEKNYL